MPLLTPLTDAECVEQCLQDDLGPAAVILTPYCQKAGDVMDICIPCDQQRNDLSLDAQRTFTDVPDQCSARTKKRESGKNLMLNISLGRGAKRMDLLAAIFDTQVVTDPTDPNCQIVEIKDEPGKCPTHFQVAILPIVGNQVDFTFGIVLDYAIANTDQFQFIFSPNTPREVQFRLEAETHPTTGLLGRFIRSADGEDCGILRDLASNCDLATSLA